MFRKDAGVLEASKTRDTPVHFYDDDPKALAVLLNATHFRFTDVPASLNVQQLYNIAILCDKYDLVHLVQPWAEHWIQHTVAPIWRADDVEKRSFIAWTFGKEEMFLTLIKLVVDSLQYNEDRKLVIGKGVRFREEELPPMLFG